MPGPSQGPLTGAAIEMEYGISIIYSEWIFLKATRGACQELWLSSQYFPVCTHQEGFSVLLERGFGRGEDGSPDVEPHPL